MSLLFQPVWSWPVVLLVGAGLIALVLWTYPSRVRHLSPRWRRTLLALRLLTALVLLFAMLRPSLMFSESDQQLSEIVIVSDTSASMQTPDGPGGITRRDAILRTLNEAEPILTKASETVDLRFVDFDEDYRPVSKPVEEAEGRFTAIGSVLDELRQDDTGKRLFAVVLMSDGAQRAIPPFDLDPRVAARRFAEQRGIPIHTIVYGASELSNAGLDLAVEDLFLVDSVTFEKKTVPVRAQIRLLGAAGRKVNVRLLREDRSGQGAGRTGELLPVPFSSGVTPMLELEARDNDETIPVELSFVAETPGEYKIAVEVQPLDGELKVTNNRLETLLTVRKGGLRVAYIDVVGRNESRFIDKLNRTAKIQLDWQVVLPGKLAQLTELRPSLFDPGAYDVYIIGDVPARVFREGGRDFLAELADRVREGAGLMMIGGQHNFGAGGYADSPLADLLPVVMSPADILADDEFSPEQQIDRRLEMLPTRSGSNLHYVMNVAARDNRRTWEQLPPLLGATRLTPKKSADVLAESSDHVPLLIISDTGRSRTMAFAADSTWMWHMHGFEEIHQRFWQQVILWLARKELEGDQQVWVRVDPRNYAPQSLVTMTFGARDDKGQPVDDATFSVNITKPDGTMLEPPAQKAGGTHLAEFRETLDPGDYWVTVTARRTGAPIGVPATTRFIVDPRDPELDNPAADPDLMAEIAALTGTAPVPAEEFGPFLESLLEAGITAELTKHTQINLWDGWPLLGLFVTLLTAEWFFRKRRGLV